MIKSLPNFVSKPAMNKYRKMLNNVIGALVKHIDIEIFSWNLCILIYIEDVKSDLLTLILSFYFLFEYV
jgi:hypothetical protein